MDDTPAQTYELRWSRKKKKERKKIRIKSIQLAQFKRSSDILGWWFLLWNSSKALPIFHSELALSAFHFGLYNLFHGSCCIFALWVWWWLWAKSNNQPQKKERGSASQEHSLWKKSNIFGTSGGICSKSPVWGVGLGHLSSKAADTSVQNQPSATGRRALLLRGDPWRWPSIMSHGWTRLGQAAQPVRGGSGVLPAPGRLGHRTREPRLGAAHKGSRGSTHQKHLKL